jgi:hypothetical protein
MVVSVEFHRHSGAPIPSLSERFSGRRHGPRWSIGAARFQQDGNEPQGRTRSIGAAPFWYATQAEPSPYVTEPGCFALVAVPVAETDFRD